MSMEITQILSSPVGDKRSNPGATTRVVEAASRAETAARQKAAQTAQAQNKDLQRSIEELREVSRVFNRRLSFSYNEDLNLVVVKVIDRETDKVIKELPPDALQRVHMRIKEAIGLLLDETV